MAEVKLSHKDMTSYYRSVHKRALHDKVSDELAPVIAPWDGWLSNAFTDFAQRLAMRRAFELLRSRHGSLARLSVLDIGCGRGRWSRIYAAQGGLVTGVDISVDAVRLLRRELPHHVFFCQDLAELELPWQFDIINSVTVIQHLPLATQDALLAKLFRYLKPGGTFVMFENTFDFDASHVFPHSQEEWILMVEQAGFQRLMSRHACFDPVLRSVRHMRRFVPGKNARRGSVDSITNPTNSMLRSVSKAVVAVCSFPLELAFSAMPAIDGTHSIMLFRHPQEAATTRSL
jgi:SAM-dependent methyltransferase